METTRRKLQVTLVLVAATLVVGWGVAQARSPIGWRPSTSGATAMSSPVATTDSGEPDVGQTVVKKHRSRRGDGPGFSWFQWTGRAWAAWYLRTLL